MKFSKDSLHDYSIHLTEAELLNCYRVISIGLHGKEDWKTWDDLLDLIDREGGKIGNSPSE